ncbi:oxygen-independent coproporphyrinogen III oxidase [Mesoterricola sediminis]|uniref:Coproporphyrinogen-III oxidase n=1 Tax=Mesoterricola sediminis TaxID=2927980 RepID=A0AA48KD44_9BACT|nr:oxygen-independent coproporphyrinogen III oxidase [Mesoterricola sediminis]BDU77854.1 oxygen-independent coproporphyrinogen III oxidase [Mesoterricola sediminis]
MALALSELIKHYDRPGPRYTGYPMPPVWSEGFPQEEVVQALGRADLDPQPLSLYAHLPFCGRRCSYCGCNVVVSPKYTPVEGFLRALDAEVELWAKHLPGRRKAVQLHWGGGTPTYLDVPDLRRTFELITRRFELLPHAEVSIEVDPTFLRPDQLPALREMGFNRVSFGVQDLDEGVQALITRGQTWQHTLDTVRQARSLGFPGINLDLVYGLPGQTLETFRRTLESTLELAPDRMAIYGFAYLPKVLAHQRTIPVETLPKPELRLELLLLAVDILEKHGYVAIGMDHFARPDDEMAKAVKEGRLIRNFMGYAVAAGSDLLGFGPSAISNVAGVYSQNEKILTKWERDVENGRFSVHKGYRLNDEDLMRRWLIHELMGTFELRWEAVRAKYGIDGRTHFADAIEELRAEVPFGTVRVEDEGIFITPLGRRFVRNLVQPFDAYLKKLAASTPFSRTV